jgi:hypothetical protein
VEGRDRGMTLVEFGVMFRCASLTIPGRLSRFYAWGIVMHARVRFRTGNSLICEAAFAMRLVTLH